jgi:RecJ-like exonuclease
MNLNYGTCPVCNGTGRRSAANERYKNVYAGYDKDTDTLPCYNCGGQYMFGKPSGKVRLNKDGVPCTHSYKGTTVGRCLTQYTCQHCGDSHQIDSGD